MGVLVQLYLNAAGLWGLQPGPTPLKGPDPAAAVSSATIGVPPSGWMLLGVRVDAEVAAL
jgi:hypothetical protein